MAHGVLLAVDLGLRTGIATYGADGRLQGYRSQNFGSPQRLKRGAATVLRDAGDLRWLVIEGGGALATGWVSAARRREIEVRTVTAEQWRAELLHPSEQRRGADAKGHADRLARAVIDWSGAKTPTSLRHDAAEAILIGLWGALAVGLLDELPEPVRRNRR